MTFAELAELWFAQGVEVAVRGAGALVDDPALFRRIRGAWGRALMASASAEAIAGQPCPWSPPCGLDVFFREQARVDGRGAPRPYRLEMDRDGEVLIVRLLIFGFAAEWVQPAADALVQALRQGIDWSGQPGTSSNRRYTVEGRRIVSPLLPPPPQAQAPLTVVFVTPLDDEAGQVVGKPASLLASLSRRLGGLARWHDAELTEDWQALGRAWDYLQMDTSALHPLEVPRVSRSRRAYDRRALLGPLRLPDGAGPAAQMITLGQSSGVGRGTTFGQGRYSLLVELGF